MEYQTKPLRSGIKLGGCMAATTKNGTLYVISNDKQHEALNGRGGCLWVLSLENPELPYVIGCLEGLGNVRQICIYQKYALITAREDGLWIVDVSIPEQPRIAAHYDPIELATGLAVEGNFLYIACRSYGIEIVTLANPEAPCHISTIRTGEAQSVAVQDGIVYAGVWGAREVVVCDSRNPERPTILSRIPLDGRGDGVFVQGQLLYAATGHHRRPVNGKEAAGPEDAAYGSGSGLEIYDMSNPAEPMLFSRIHMPLRSYYPTYDMWSVAVSDGYAYMAFSFLGVFVIDVRDPYHPTIVYNYITCEGRDSPLYIDLSATSGLELFKPLLPFNAKEQMVSPATGFALSDGYMYITTGLSDLYVTSVQGLVCSNNQTPPQFPRAIHPVKANPWLLYKPQGQVHAACRNGNTIYTACGTAGLHVLSLEDCLRPLEIFPVQGIVFDVKQHGQHLFVAESGGGLSIWNKETMRIASRWQDEHGLVVLQVMLSADGRFAMLHTGYSSFTFLNVEDPSNPYPILTDSSGEWGGIYARQICSGILQKKYMAGHWNSRYIQWYDVSGELPVITPWRQPHIGFVNGLAIYEECALATHNGGYVLFDFQSDEGFGKLDHFTIREGRLSGKPTVYKNMLLVSDRVGGQFWMLDIHDIKHPKLLLHEETDGNPEPMTPDDDFILCPLGNAGLKLFSVESTRLN